MTIRVVLADDQALLREAFALLLDAADDIEVAGEASDGHEAVALTREHRPDVVLMDIRMPELDVLAATEAICADPALAASRILILTTFEDDEYVARALRAGASGFIGKGIAAEGLRDAVRTHLRSSDVQLRPHPWQPKRISFGNEGNDLGVPARVFPQWLRCTGCDMLGLLSQFGYTNTPPFRTDLACFEHLKCTGRPTAPRRAARRTAVPARRCRT